MAAYLIANPPAREGGQFFRTRNRPLTGCTVLHTAEGVLDTVGPDTGAENVAAFIQRRADPGSYHDLADSDSYVHLVPYESGAFHDGTGSNNWALSISFACRTTDWDRMAPEKRRGFLRQGARAFAAQQAWRKANGFPLTELRLISKAQSDRGESGFTYHGLRDPGRRTDPGTTPTAPFPIAEFITECAIALGILEEDFMSALTDDEQRELLLNSRQTRDVIGAQGGLNTKTETTLTFLVRDLAPTIRGLPKLIAATDDDPRELAAIIAPMLTGPIAEVATAIAARPAGQGLTEEQVQELAIDAISRKLTAP